jgi:hypothetical protein
VKYLRRFVWWLVSRLLVVSVVLGLMVVTFYYAMNLSNIQIVLKDGMARRVQVVMGMEDMSELDKYFQGGFIERDAVLATVLQGTTPYRDYNVRGIDHRLEMGFAWIWPWDTSVRLEITERIPRIDGRAKGSRAEELVARGGENAVYPPAWQSARYRVVLIRENGQWKINSLSLLENLTD